MKNKEVIFSKRKMIIFGIIIDILVSSIVSFGTYDIINACYGEIMPINRKQLFLTLFPNVLVVIAGILLSYTLISIKYNKKTK